MNHIIYYSLHCKVCIILNRCCFNDCRFGSGLVIYWFGFVKEICQGSEEQGILIRNCFPEAHEITIITEL